MAKTTTMEDPTSPSDIHKSISSSSSSMIMDKLKTTIIERVKKLYPNKTLSPQQIHCIQLQLQRAFPSFHIPTHPTYSCMIEKAIQELNEKGGSSKEAISEYILANFEDLPWAHNRFLSHYLDKLCMGGEVVCVSSNRYSVPWLIDEFSKKKSLMKVKANNLDGTAKNADVGLFEEDNEEARALVKYRAKRKRNSLVVQDAEDKEAAGTEIIEKHDNEIGNSSEVPVKDNENAPDVSAEAQGENGTNDKHHIVAVDEVQSVSEQIVGEQEEESRNEPRNGRPAVVSVSGEDSPKDTSDKLVLEKMVHDSCPSDLKIVAAEEDTEVVCCLFVPQSEPPKKRLVFRPRKKLKRRRIGKLTTSAARTASPDFTEGPNMRREYHPRKKSKHEDFSTRAPDMKRDLKSDLMFMDDESLKLPLEVLKMHGKQGKYSMEAEISKSEAGSVDPLNKKPQKGIRGPRRKRKLQDDQKSCDEPVAAPESETPRPLRISFSMAAATSEKRAVKPPHEMRAQVTVATYGFDDLRHELGENGQIKGGHGLFHKLEQYDGINPREPSQAEDKSAHKDLEHPLKNNQQQERPTEPAINLVMEKEASKVSPVFEEIMEEQNEGRIANSPVEPSPSVKLTSSHHDLEYNDMNPRESSKVKNETALKGHHQQQERPSVPATSLIIKLPSVKSSPSCLYPEEVSLKQNESAVPDLAMSMKAKMPGSNRWSLQEKDKVKIERLTPPKNENENQDAVGSNTAAYQQMDSRNKQRNKEAIDTVPMSLHDQLEKQSKSATCKKKKKDGRGRPRKIKETIIKDVPAPLDLYNMLQEELAQAAVCKSENKDGGENSSGQTEPVTQDEKVANKEPDSTRKDETVVADSHPRQKKVSSVQANHQMKNDGPVKSECAEKSPIDLNLVPLELPAPDASNLSSPPVERERKQLNDCCPVDKVHAMSQPVSLRTRSKRGGAHKSETAESLLGSEAHHQREEPVPILLDEEFYQKEVSKTEEETKQWQSSSENLEESEAEVHKSLLKPEQLANCSDDESLLVDQPRKIEGELQNSIGNQSRSKTTLDRQNSCEYSPSSAIRRSQRINKRSQGGS